jgi:hypothetical protein
MTPQQMIARLGKEEQLRYAYFLARICFRSGSGFSSLFFSFSRFGVVGAKPASPHLRYALVFLYDTFRIMHLNFNIISKSAPFLHFRPQNVFRPFFVLPLLPQRAPFYKLEIDFFHHVRSTHTDFKGLPPRPFFVSSSRQFHSGNRSPLGQFPTKQTVRD